MCLAVPSKIVALQGEYALVDLDGIQRQVSLRLVEDVGVGDYVIVHSGFAIHKIDEDQARESLAILRQAVGLMNGPQL